METLPVIDPETTKAALEGLLPALATVIEAALNHCADADGERRRVVIAELCEVAAMLARAGMAIGRCSAGEPPTLHHHRPGARWDAVAPAVRL